MALQSRIVLFNSSFVVFLILRAVVVYARHLSATHAAHTARSKSTVVGGVRKRLVQSCRDLRASVFRLRQSEVGLSRGTVMEISSQEHHHME